jgi:hypothetical protein
MTDDKVAGEGPYKHGCTLTGKYLCPACIYAEGQKEAEKDLRELSKFVDKIIEFFWTLYLLSALQR